MTIEREPGGRELRGRALAAEIARVAARRAAAFAGASGRPVGVAAVGWSTDPTTGRFLATKEQSFRRAGLAFRGVVLDPGDGSAAAASSVAALSRDDAVDGIFVQYPTPSVLDVLPVLDAVAPEKDIDGGRRGGRGGRGGRGFPSATAVAVLRVLAAHAIPVRGARTVVVGGQPAIAGPVAALLEREGAAVEEVPADAATAARLAAAELVVVASGRPGSVPDARLPAGAVVVDTGYYHGGGRGDVVWTDAQRRLEARVPPIGGVGPVTVAVLMAHAVEAAERRRPVGGGR